MTSNKVINLNKIRAAATAGINRPEAAVLLFDYHAPESNAGQVEQRPLVKVVPDSLHQLKGGEWAFKGINLYRVGDLGGTDRGVRTYRVSRINGIAHRPV